MFKDLHKNFNQQFFDKCKAYRKALNRTIQGAKQMYHTVACPKFVVASI